MASDRAALDDLNLAYIATREILRARDADAARSVVIKLCRDLGASMVNSDDDIGNSLPIDLSLGEGEPQLPVADDPQLREVLIRYLVPAVSDARTVVERGLSSKRLVENATRDALTGVWSRRSLSFAINQSRPGDCVALIDLDHFKSVNDTLGHDAGDVVLSEFGAHLRGGVRDLDIVGRLGGEEFVVLFPRTSLTEAFTVLQRLRDSWPAFSTQRISFSAGVAMVQEVDGAVLQPGQAALKRADTLMYEAKSSGRDRIISDTA